MTVTQIIHFSAPSASAADTQAHAAIKALKGTKAPDNYVLGTQTKNQRLLQLTSEWHDPSAEVTPAADEYRNTVLSSLGNPQKMFHVSFISNSSVFEAPNGPLSSPLVEFVQIFFPAEKVTDEFRTKIEKDFERFDEQCMTVARGNGGVAVGWVLEEQEHESLKKGEKAKCFFVARGWEGMQFFDEVVSTDVYKEAVEILLAWKAPWDLWHVKREF